MDRNLFTPSSKGTVRLVGFLLGIGFWVNVYVFLYLFFTIVTPRLNGYLELACLIVLPSALGRNLLRARPGVFLAFYSSLLTVNAIAIWKSWYAH